MRIYIDDGSTHIKMLWEQHGRTFTHLSPNSFKRGWSATFGNGKPFNYTADKEKYSFDLISPDSLTTSNIKWQYSPFNALAVHHALQTSGPTPQGVDNQPAQDCEHLQTWRGHAERSGNGCGLRRSQRGLLRNLHSAPGGRTDPA